MKAKIVGINASKIKVHARFVALDFVVEEDVQVMVAMGRLELIGLILALQNQVSALYNILRPTLYIYGIWNPNIFHGIIQHLFTDFPS